MKLLFLGAAGIFLALSFGTVGSANDLARGMLIYKGNCLQCHGENGDGNGPEAVNLDTAPRNFTSSPMDALTDSMLDKAVVEGISTVPTHSWGNILSKDDVAAVLQYIRTFRK
jgi:mono/diheme cytochrome c family protein